MQRLTQAYLKKRLEYNPRTGVFIWKPWPANGIGWNNRRVGTVAGGLNGDYLFLGLGVGKSLPLHKLATLYMTGKYPKYGPDHKDLNPTNNRWLNLRQATVHENNRNRRMHKNNRLGHKNVSVGPGGKFLVYVMKNKKQLYFGTHETLEKAISAARAARVKLFGEFARHA